MTPVPVRQVDAELHRFFARRIVRGLAALVVAIAAASIGVAVVHSDNGVDVGRGLSDTLTALAIVLVFLGVALGASFVGADFNLGSLSSQLLYEPRRWHLHIAKATAVAIGCAAFALTVCVIVGALMFLGSALHGVTEGIDASWWQHRGVELARAVAACAAGAVMAYAVTIVTRRSSAAIVLFLLQYPFILIVSPEARVPFGPLSRVAPLRALLAVAFDPARDHSGTAAGIATTAGGVVLTLVWVVALLAASGARFSRAEIR